MPLWQRHSDIFSLPDHCEPQNALLRNLSTAFDTCIPTPLALLSTVLGSLSILAWLFAQLPQIYKNYKLGSTAGLSIYFLLEWCLGDTANLIGAILTKQATWQVVVAGYYTFVDCVLVFQFIYFTRFGATPVISSDSKAVIRGPHAGQDGQLSQPPKLDQRRKGSLARPIRRPRDPIFDTFRFPGSPSPREKNGSPGNSRGLLMHTTASPVPSPKTVLMLSLVLTLLSRTQASPLPISSQSLQLASSSTTSTREIVGNIISWASTVLYLGSRLPQIYKNYKRRSTAGLSPALFIAAFFGNLFYSTSLLTNPLAWSSYGPHGGRGWAPAEGSDRATWVGLAIPFFLGSAGVLALDAAVGVQFLIYGEGERGAKVVRVVDSVDGEEEAKGHWRRVSGWMRGWVPSPKLSPQRGNPPSFARLDSDIEGEDGDARPLLSRDSFEDRGYGGVRN